ncbi:MAG TPA: peptidase S41, partial [Flavobacteriaceae bacterium]|nr:peptidase S41 [Flavobacteriaceae bacterium]
MKKIILLTVTFFTLLFISCDKDDDVKEDPVTEVKLENEVNAFVWKGLNKHYYWQSDIPDLADTKNDDVNAFNTYLNGHNESKNLFESLLFDKGETDRFSWFIENYEDQQASFRGVNDAFGFEFSLARVTKDGNEVIGYVTYVVPNSPA